MIKKHVLDTMAKTINQVLTKDANTLKKLASINNKTIQITIIPTHSTFFIQIKDSKFKLLPKFKGIVDTVIASSPSGFLRLSILPTTKIRQLFNGEVEISGDIELGQKIKNIFDNLDIDWEGHVADVTGDVVAEQLSQFIKGFVSYKRSSYNSLKESLNEYLHEEASVSPPKEEIEDFFNDVYSLRLQVERIEAKIQQIKKTHEKD